MALSYETWMMFLVGVSVVAIGAKLAPGLGGRLPIYKMSNKQIFAVGFPLVGCLSLRVFSEVGPGGKAQYLLMGSHHPRFLN